MNFRLRNYEIDVARQELRCAGAIVHVEPQVFDVLVHLIRNRNRIVSKDELIDTIWQGRIVSEATLSSRISAARRAIGDSGNDQGLIRTVHKRGFRFVGSIDAEDSGPAAFVIENGAAAPLVPTGEPLPPTHPARTTLPFEASGHDADRQRMGALAVAEAPLPATFESASETGAGSATPADSNAAATQVMAAGRRWRPRTALLVAAAAMALAAAPAAWWLLSWRSPAVMPQAKDGIALAGKAASTDRHKARPASIAVLPFINLSGDAREDYLADGITDSLISDLVHALPGISVIARDTAFTFKGRSADARQIGRELDVRYLLTGSVLPEGQRIRVNIQLVETEQSNQLLTERFDTERKGILQVEDEIVARVSRATGLKVVDVEARRSLRERPASGEVIDLILRGKAVLNQPSSALTLIGARELFEQALLVQPSNVDGMAGVASTLVFEFLNGYYDTGGEERLRTAEQLLDRALAIEPRHLMGLKARAALRRAQGRFHDAIAAAEAIITEHPGEPWAYKEIGLSALYLGQPQQALDWFAKADRIGPRDPGRWTWLDGRGHALILLGQDEDAIHALLAALDANPRNTSPHAFLAAAYALSGRDAEARAALAAYLQKRPATRVSTFRTRSPVPLALTDPAYRRLRARLAEGLRKAGMPE